MTDQPSSYLETTYVLNLTDIILSARTDKIKAIKTLREATGLGLKDAKDVIELLTRETMPIREADYEGYRSWCRSGGTSLLTLQEQNADLKAQLDTLRATLDDAIRANNELHSKSSFLTQTLREALTLIDPRLVRHPDDY